MEMNYSFLVGVCKVVQLNPALTDPLVTEIRLWETIFKSLEKKNFIFYIGNNKNPSITE